jgi:hypothetical protein
MPYELPATQTEAPILSFTDCVSYLEACAKSGKPVRSQYLIDSRIRPITARDLERLTRLPYEVGLSESNGKILLAIGDSDSVPWHSHEHRTTALNSRYNLHTHPSNTAHITHDTPSLSDLHVALDTNPSTILAIFHRSGVTVFRRPSHNPITGVPFSKSLEGHELETLFEHYLRFNGVTMNDASPKQFKKFFELSDLEQNALQRGFANQCGSVVAKIAWTDTHELERILRPLNAGPRS